MTEKKKFKPSQALTRQLSQRESFLLFWKK